MFWGFLLAIGLAAALTKLGAASVWVTVLSAAVHLLGVLVLLACTGAALAWWRRSRRK